VAVPPEPRVLLGDARVGRNGAVEKIPGVLLQQRRDRRRQESGAPEHRLTQQDVRARRPGERVRRKQGEQKGSGDRATKDHQSMLIFGSTGVKQLAPSTHAPSSFGISAEPPT